MSRMHKHKLFFLLLGCLFSLMACNSPTNPVKKTATTPSAAPIVQAEEENMLDLPQLNNKAGWLLEKMADTQGQLVPVRGTARITLLFSADKLTGTNGCNHYFSSYIDKQTALSIATIGATMKACGDDEMRLGHAYLEHLQTVTSYQIIDTQLQLSDTSGNILLQFSVENPAVLVDTHWQLLSLNTGNALVSNATTQTITALFKQAGQVQGFAGCNNYAGIFRKYYNRLFFAKVDSFHKTCTTPKDVMETEKQFIAALKSVQRFEVSAQTLTLLGNDNRRLVIFKKAK